MTTDTPTNVDEAFSGEATGYRAVSPVAIIALLLGVLSAAALLHPVGCTVAMLGVVVSILALNRIAAAGSELIGRKAALLGLGLSIAFGIAAPTQWATTRWWLERDAERYALNWFNYLRSNQPEMALQMTLSYSVRRPPAQVLGYYRSQPEAQAELKKYVDDPAIRTLLALGDKATVRLYETGEIIQDADGELVEQFYAVTYPDERTRQPHTFFMRLEVDRLTNKFTGESRWRLNSARGGVRPPSL